MEAGQHRPVAILFYRQLKVKYFNLFANIDPIIILLYSVIFSYYSIIFKQTHPKNIDQLARNNKDNIPAI